MLDTRSGQLLTSQSFNDAFSQLQFTADGVSFLLHKAQDASQEMVEVHHLDVVTKEDRLITRYTHITQQKTRPSLWRGSFSPDGTIVVYQSDVLVPVVNVVNARDGKHICQIRWEEDLTALPVYIDARNELIAIPLAQWDAQYNYGSTRKLLLAHLKTGQILGKYDVPQSVRHVRFQDKSILLVDHADRVGSLSVGAPSIAWQKQMVQPGKQVFFHANAAYAGFFSRSNNNDPMDYQQLSGEPGNAVSRLAIEKGFLPVAFRGDMLVSEKHTPRDLPAWLNTINERCISMFGRYLVSPLLYTLRYQDATTGEILNDYSFEERYVLKPVSNRISGSTILAAVRIDQEHLSIEFIDLFSFWTIKKLAVLAFVITLVLTGVPGSARQRRLSWLRQASVSCSPADLASAAR